LEIDKNSVATKYKHKEMENSRPNMMSILTVGWLTSKAAACSEVDTGSGETGGATLKFTVNSKIVSILINFYSQISIFFSNKAGARCFHPPNLHLCSLND
jgi:hypothetical protein